MSCCGSDVEVLNTVHLLPQCRHLVEVSGKQGERPDLLGYVSARGQHALSISLFIYYYTERESL